MNDLNEYGSIRQVRDEHKSLLAAEILQKMVRSRRYYLDDFLDGDGPFWISIGLYIDDVEDRVAGLDQILEYADESVETCRYILRRMMSRGYVQEYSDEHGEPAYRLTSRYSEGFGRYLRHQYEDMRRTCSRVDRPVRPSETM